MNRWDIRRGRRPRDSSGGFSLLEVAFVLTLIGILAAMASGPLSNIRESSAIQNGRHAVTSALSLASSTGTRWGRTSVLRIDSIRDELRIVVDTSSAGSRGDSLVVRVYRLGEDLGVALSSNRRTLCFNSRGVGTSGVECAESGGWIALRYGGRADTLTVSSAGRVRR